MYIKIIRIMISVFEKALDRLEFYEEMYEWEYFQGDLIAIWEEE